MRWAASVALLALVACGGGEAPVEEPESTSAPVEEVAPEAAAEEDPTGHDKPSASARLTVVFTNNIDGEIEPCG